jgi:hypothetical protein
MTSCWSFICTICECRTLRVKRKDVHGEKLRNWVKATVAYIVFTSGEMCVWGGGDNSTRTKPRTPKIPALWVRLHHVCFNDVGQKLYEGVPKSFRTRRLERELQMVQLSLCAVVSLFCESVLWVLPTWPFVLLLNVCLLLLFISLWFSPETFGYVLIFSSITVFMILPPSERRFTTTQNKWWFSSLICEHFGKM